MYWATVMEVVVTEGQILAALVTEFIYVDYYEPILLCQDFCDRYGEAEVVSVIYNALFNYERHLVPRLDDTSILEKSDQIVVF